MLPKINANEIRLNNTIWPAVIATKRRIIKENGFVKIPMVGFTESLNISVSAAVTLYTLSSRLKKSSLNWRLSAEEEREIHLQWLRNSIPKSAIIEKDFLQKSK